MVTLCLSTCVPDCERQFEMFCQSARVSVCIPARAVISQHYESVALATADMSEAGLRASSVLVKQELLLLLGDSNGDRRHPFFFVIQPQILSTLSSLHCLAPFLLPVLSFLPPPPPSDALYLSVLSPPFFCTTESRCWCMWVMARSHLRSSRQFQDFQRWPSFFGERTGLSPHVEFLSLKWDNV